MQEKIILKDFYYHFQENKKTQIKLTNILCILSHSDQSNVSGLKHSSRLITKLK